MNIYHDYEAIKSMALYHAKEHGVNYNVILMNPVDGKFSLSNGSTYEFVQDSYFEKPRPNALLLFKTNDEPQEETVETEEMYDVPELRGSFKPLKISSKRNPFESEPMYITNPYAGLQNNKRPQPVRPSYDHVRTGEGHMRNQECGCGSGKKYKKCCINK